MDAETRARVTLWQQKTADGTITLEEMKAAIVYLRGGRSAALTASAAAKSGAKAKKPARSADDMLADFES